MIRTGDLNKIEVVDATIAAILRSKTVTERVAMTADANDMARLLAAAGIRHCYPDWTEKDVQSEVAGRMLGATN